MHGLIGSNTQHLRAFIQHKGAEALAAALAATCAAMHSIARRGVLVS